MSILRVFIISSGGGLMALGLFAVSLLRCFLFPIPDMPFTALFLTFYRLPADHFKHEDTNSYTLCEVQKASHNAEEYAWTLNTERTRGGCLPLPVCTSFHRSEQQNSPFLSERLGARSAEHFCPVTSNPPQRSADISLMGVHLWRRVRMERRWERGRKEERKEGGSVVIAVVAQWLWRRLDDWVHL